MKGQRTKNRFIYRRSWGSVRSRVRQRFAKGNYEIEPDYLRANDSWELHHISDGRLRERLKLHKDRFRKVPWILNMVIGYGKGDTSGLERMFGMFYPRCTKCGEKLWHLYLEDELAGLCNQCAAPIIQRREEERTMPFRERAEALARRLLPDEVRMRFMTPGWVRIMGSNGTNYRLDKNGWVYNEDAHQSYCVHPKTGFLQSCFWDRVVEMYLLLRWRAHLVETKAVKSNYTDTRWNMVFGFPRPKGKTVVTGVIPTPRR